MHKRLSVLFWLAGSSLMAQGVRINGGAHAGLASPIGDFATKETPFGEHLGANGGLGGNVGGHLDFNFNPHHQLRFHITIHAFVSGTKGNFDSSRGDFRDLDDDDFDHYDHDNADSKRDNTFGIAQFGGEYVYNFTSPSKGFYLLAGVNLNFVSKEKPYSLYGERSFTQSGCVGSRLGAGYTFNRFISVEGQINHISVDANGTNGFGFNALDWVSVSAVFRFGRAY